MPRLPWLADAARATGHPVIEVDQWQTRGTTLFNPKGVVWHHTAGAALGDMPSLNILVNGRAGLPGPLSQYGLGRSGTIYVVAAGRANHAGDGGWNGLMGNGSVVGIEAEHTGKPTDPWPVEQLDAYQKLSAQILVRPESPVALMCGHKEWAPLRKVDPTSLDMADERVRVAALIQGDDGVASSAQKMWVDFAFNAFPDVFMGDANVWYGLDEHDPQWDADFRPALSRAAAKIWKERQGHPHIAPGTGGLTVAQVKAIVESAKIDVP